jgi:hypothetical protein
MLRSASALAASWQCQRCDYTYDSAKNKRHCFSCRAWRDEVLRRGCAMTASVTLYGTIWYCFKTPPPPPPRPCLFLCRLLLLSAVRRPSSAARHPLPAFVAKFATQSSRLSSLSPPALVASFAAPPSDSSHHPPPAVHATTLPPLSLLQPPPHPNHSRCAVRVSLSALVTLSARRRHCRRDPLLAPTALVTPSAAWWLVTAG